MKDKGGKPFWLKGTEAQRRDPEEACRRQMLAEPAGLTRQRENAPGPGPTLTYCVCSVLFPVHCGLSVLWWVGLGHTCWGRCGCCCRCGRCRCCRRRRAGLLLSELLPESLLPRLYHVGHHSVDQGQGLYGTAIKDCPILGRKQGIAISPQLPTAPRTALLYSRGIGTDGRACGSQGHLWWALWAGPVWASIRAGRG